MSSCLLLLFHHHVDHIEQSIEQYINQQKVGNSNDLADCLLQMHNNKSDVKKYNHKYVMNSDQIRIQHSMPPVYTTHQTGKPAVVDITYRIQTNMVVSIPLLNVPVL